MLDDSWEVEVSQTLINQFNTPLTGTNATTSPTALPGTSGRNGGPADETLNNQNLSAVPSEVDLHPAATGGIASAGVQGALGTTSLTVTEGDPIVYTWGKGGKGGAGGNGGNSGAAEIQLAKDTIGTASHAYSNVVEIDARASGSTGYGSGAGGGEGGFAGSESGGLDDPVIYDGSFGGAGGNGGKGGVGGSGQAIVSGLSAYTTQAAYIDLTAQGGDGGDGSAGGGGGAGAAGGAGGNGGTAGNGGESAATLSGSEVAANTSLQIQLYAYGGVGGEGGAGNTGGDGQVSTQAFTTNTYAANGNGGNGGTSGEAEISLTGNKLTAPQMTLDVGVLGYIGGPGGLGGQPGVPGPGTTYSQAGKNGTNGATSPEHLILTGNTITVGHGVPGFTWPADEPSTLTLSLGVNTSGIVGTQTLDGAAGGNLDFANNHFAGRGTSELELNVAGGGVTVDTATDTISIGGSSLNTLTGFDSFILDPKDTFVAGSGKYSVGLGSATDTLVYTPKSGNVTLEGATLGNLLLDFQDFGTNFDSYQQFEEHVTPSNGSTVISVPGAGKIELLGYDSSISPAEVMFGPIKG
jgi:hypothetical protein